MHYTGTLVGMCVYEYIEDYIDLVTVYGTLPEL